MSDTLAQERADFVQQMAPLIGFAQSIQPIPNPRGLAQMARTAARRSQGDSPEDFAGRMWDNKRMPDDRYNAQQEYYNCLIQHGGNDRVCRPLLDKYFGKDKNLEKELDAPIYISPIVLDLDGDGIETISIENGVYVDPNEDGIFTRQGWLSADDGFLVIDRDGNGVITGREYFGETFLLDLVDYEGNNIEANSGYTALHSVDDYIDFSINNRDSVFGDLLIFRDLNSDGVSDSSELFTLAELGISSLDLLNIILGEVDAQGNDHKLISSYLDSNGNSFLMADVYFRKNIFDSVENESVFSSVSLPIPNTLAIGGVHSLYYQVAHGHSSLQNLAVAYQSEASAMKRREILVEILFSSAEVPNTRPPEYVNFTDYQYRVITYLGKVYDVLLTRTGALTNMDYYLDVFDDIVNYQYLNVELSGPQLEKFLAVEVGTIGNEKYFDFEKTIELFYQDIAANPAVALDNLYGFIFAVWGMSPSSGGAFIDLWRDLGMFTFELKKEAELNEKGLNFAQALLESVSAMGMYEFRDGGDVNTGAPKYENGIFLVGNNLNEQLTGSSKNDVISGGGGNDLLAGAEGDDIYQWSRGDGNDQILDFYGQNKLYLGVNVSDVEVLRQGSAAGADSLLIRIKDSNESLMISGWFGSVANGDLKEVIFNDGTTLTRTDLDLMLRTIKGDDESNSLSGFSTNEVLLGLGGNDYLYGNDGDDTLSGGTGADILNGGSGNDQLDGDEGNDQLKGGSDNDVLNGGSGNDNLEGESGDDDLHGGAGNDTMTGGSGNDVYRWGRGDGHDTIYDYDNIDRNNPLHQDTLIFQAGITAEDIAWSRSDYHLVATIKDTGETLVIQYWFNGEFYRLSTIQLADGTPIDIAAIDASVRTITGSDLSESLSGFNTNDLLIGLGGNDHLYGNDGDDTLSGGSGADNLNGGSGNDQLDGDEGNDQLKGGGDNDVLRGGTGTDSLEGESGDDDLHGGADNDTMTGGSGNDVYRWGRGDGNDTIYDYDNIDRSNPSHQDTLIFQAGITTEDIAWSRSDYHLVATIKDTGETLMVQYWFNSPSYRLEAIQLADGTPLDIATIETSARTITGSDFAESLSGFNTNDLLIGLGGNDHLYGNDGDDTLNGGAGSDNLNGGLGNDLYLFERNGAVDTIFENDFTVDNIDVIQLGSDIAVDQLWFRHVGNNLEVSIVGTSDKLVINNWYYGSSYQVEQIKLSNGSTLLNTQVEALVSAMAAFAPPSGSGAVISQDVKDQLQSVWATSWQ